jgi:hypothetical protein
MMSCHQLDGAIRHAASFDVETVGGNCMTSTGNELEIGAQPALADQFEVSRMRCAATVPAKYQYMYERDSKKYVGL